MDDVLIPAGVDIRIRFESSVETFLRCLAEQLQTNAEGVFFVQQDPFHIKVMSSIDIRGCSGKKVAVILQEVGARFDDVKGQVLPVCIVDGDGRVSLKITSSDCIEVIREVSQLMLDGNCWSVDRDDDLRVSIGSFKGPHTNAFENWLNGELRCNSSAFPLFNADSIQLSESNIFMPEPVRLTQKEKLFVSDMLVDLRDLDTETDQDVEGNLQQPAAVIATVCNIDAIVLELTISSAAITQKLNGTAVIKKEVRKSSQTTLTNSTRYSITPSESKQWQDVCLSMIHILKGTLQSVGSKDFLKALDDLANFNHPDSLSSDLQPLLDDTPGSFLELIAIRDMHIEAMTDAEEEEDSGITDLHDVVVPLTVSDYTESQSSSTSSLLIYLAEGNQTLLDHRFSNTPCTAPTRALLTMHISPTSLLALGLKPLNGRKDFYLPFGWINVKDPSTKPRTQTYNGRNSSYTHGSQIRGPFIPGYSSYKGLNGARFNGSGRGHGNGSANGNGNTASIPQNTAPHTISDITSPPMSLNSNPNIHSYSNSNSNSHTSSMPRPAPLAFHYGDWICPACKALVYSFRPDCYKCRTLRPDSGPHIVPRQPQRTSSKPDGDVRDGDWLCITCKGHNFANKLACFTCRTPRPLPPSAYSPETSECTDTTIATIGSEGATAATTVDESTYQIDAKHEHAVDKEVEKEVEKEVSRTAERLPKAMPGDWTCPSCHENVFAKRYRCYKCCTAKPR